MDKNIEGSLLIAVIIIFDIFIIGLVKLLSGKASNKTGKRSLCGEQKGLH